MSEFEKKFPKEKAKGIYEMISWLDNRQGWLEACEWFLSMEEEWGKYAFGKVEEERNMVKELQ